MAVLPRKTRPEDWKPVGLSELEINALQVVHATEHLSVIAGPGAGKTELLAQRAAYLLQTETAPNPRRILAISFKRDAAKNLAMRVRQRCNQSHAQRFDSMTFDAFAKSLIDRFGQSLPQHWRPRPDYDIIFPNKQYYQKFLDSNNYLKNITAEYFIQNCLVRKPLPLDGWCKSTQFITKSFWHWSLHEGKKSALSFPMIVQLAELLLRANPILCDVLRLTYSHLFMDEFQDATDIQYNLVRTAFQDAETVITAVGDNKQRIMGWAMAMDDSFATFEENFGAKRISLSNNYRSSPDLVRIQSVLAKALDTRSAEPISKTSQTFGDESCVILNFSNPEFEAKWLAGFVMSEMKTHSLGPRDFVLLVRQKADQYADILKPAFMNAGIPLRNESGTVGGVMLQDLVVEPASELILAILRLAMTVPASQYWVICQEEFFRVRGVISDDDISQIRLAQELDAFARQLNTDYPQPPKSNEMSRSIVNHVINFVGRDRIIADYPAYEKGGWLENILDSVAQHLWRSSDGYTEWQSALDAYEGRHAVPLMTIHKSKGLEYHSVIFIGLDDDAWWSFPSDQFEATAGLFVAFTRAKQRVLFTYCAQRGTKTKIAPLYRLLKESGVKSFIVPDQ